MCQRCRLPFYPDWDINHFFSLQQRIISSSHLNNVNFWSMNEWLFSTFSCYSSNTIPIVYYSVILVAIFYAAPWKCANFSGSIKSQRLNAIESWDISKQAKSARAILSRLIVFEIAREISTKMECEHATNSIVTLAKIDVDFFPFFIEATGNLIECAVIAYDFGHIWGSGWHILCPTLTGGYFRDAF